jgi:hypothetical protein
MEISVTASILIMQYLRQEGLAGSAGRQQQACVTTYLAFAHAAKQSGSLASTALYTRCCTHVAFATLVIRRARQLQPPPPPPIDAPCTQYLRHGDPMHARERLTAAAASPVRRCCRARAAARALTPRGGAVPVGAIALKACFCPRHGTTRSKAPCGEIAVQRTPAAWWGHGGGAEQCGPVAIQNAR